MSNHFLYFKQSSSGYFLHPKFISSFKQLLNKVCHSPSFNYKYILSWILILKHFKLVWLFCIQVMSYFCILGFYIGNIFKYFRISLVHISFHSENKYVLDKSLINHHSIHINLNWFIFFTLFVFFTLFCIGFYLTVNSILHPIYFIIS